MAKKTKNNVDNKIVSRIYGYGRGWVFTPNHFKDLGSRDAIASALKRHKQSGLIRQLARGVYDYPQTDPDLGPLEPTNEEIAKALAGRDATRLQPSGAYAANLLGLSTQVPTKIVYLTDGRSRTVQIGKRQISLKQTTPRNMATAGKISGLVIQALRYLGKKNVDLEVIDILRKKVSAEDHKQLMKDIRYAPAWIADIFHDLDKKWHGVELYE
ncbi:MAG: hypothetical protein CSB34_00940 [Desulfobulbus propionicus]|nr:MAG: hypothetical protein CSB34_00940 [Desulfobulbus propionicus]